jgi:hypothetical protein
MVSSNKLKLEKLGKVQTTSRSQELRFQAYTLKFKVLPQNLVIPKSRGFGSRYSDAVITLEVRNVIKRGDDSVQMCSS